MIFGQNSINKGLSISFTRVIRRQISPHNNAHPYANQNMKSNRMNATSPGPRFSSTLIFDKAYINGAWTTAKSGSYFRVLNPSNGNILTTVPDMNDEDTGEAVLHATNAFPMWKNKSAKERGFLLRRWYDLIVHNKEELAKIITAENGKTIAEARGEVIYGASFVEWFSEEARRTYGDIIPSPISYKKIMVLKQPIGVCGMITPWNFPNAMITRKVAPAIAAGCTVVLRPAEDTPLSALALCQLAEEAGIPPGVLNVVTSSRPNADKIGRVLCTHPSVRAISFTGSTHVGKYLLNLASDSVKRVSLELGGNAPFIVFDSANINKAVQGAILCKFRGSGQTCVCANRFYVQDGVYDEFIDAFASSIATLKCGDGFDPKVTMGPLINERALLKVEQLVTDAVEHGAHVACGGRRHPSLENHYEPTLLTNVSPRNPICDTEIFGPVAPVIRFKTEAEVLEMANGSQYGLAGYFYTEDMSQAWRVAENLEVGMVGVNESILSSAEAPFGGVKQSGLGREGSKYGIDEFIETKYMCLRV